MLPEVREKFEKAWEAKEKELISKGYPEGLVRKAKKFAEDYIQGVTGKLYKEAPREIQIKAQEYAIDDGLRFAESWIKGLYEAFAPLPTKVEEKLKEVMG